MPFDHRSGHLLQVDDAALYYEIVGTKGAPPLLLLHGGFGTIEDFNGVLAPLERDFEIVGLDSRGQGRSTLGSAALTYAALAADVERLLGHLQIERPRIVGISDGGIVGYRLAATSAVAVDRLVTVSARWDVRQAERTGEKFRATTGETQRRDDPDGYATYRDLNPEPDFDRLARALVGMWLDAGASGHPSEAVSSIACPLLAVHGDDDELVTRQAVVDLVERVDGARFLNVPFAKHPVQKDQPDIFSIAVDRFLRD